MNRKSQKKYWAMNAINKSEDPDKVTCSVCGQPFGKNDVNAKKRHEDWHNIKNQKKYATKNKTWGNVKWD